MSLRVYNVLSRQKETFEPLTPGKVNIYVCGPTVYDYSHIGHAKTYVSFDVIVRYLRYLSYDVLYVQNITDVGHMLDTGEDRILKKARQTSARGGRAGGATCQMSQRCAAVRSRQSAG